MHQILSYQTAMRANHERDSREYITRRICVSFVLSVGFFTLIAGESSEEGSLIEWKLTTVSHSRIPPGQVRVRSPSPDPPDETGKGICADQEPGVVGKHINPGGC